MESASGPSASEVASEGRIVAGATLQGVREMFLGGCRLDCAPNRCIVADGGVVGATFTNHAYPVK